MQNSIYITYNPNSSIEKNLAYDLYNKGRQNGYLIYLPERNYSNQLSQKTKLNIEFTEWFVVFSTTHLSNTVTEEINHAFNYKEDNQIIVIYSAHTGKNIDFGNRKPIEMFVNDYDFGSIENFKNDLFKKLSPKTINKKEGVNALEVLLGIGAAILLIKTLANDKKD